MVGTHSEDEQEDLPRFHPPKVQDNPRGWGPVGLPDKFKNLPFQNYEKGARIGKIADWLGTDKHFQDRRSMF